MILIFVDLIEEIEEKLQEELYLSVTLPNAMRYEKILFYEKTNNTYYPIIEHISRNPIIFGEEYTRYIYNHGGPLIKEIKEILEASLLTRKFQYVEILPAYTNDQFIFIKRDQRQEIEDGTKLEKILTAKGYKKVTVIEPREALNEFPKLNAKEATEIFTGKKLKYIETMAHDIEEIKNKLSFSQEQLDRLLQREASNGKIEITEERINIKLYLHEDKIIRLKQKYREQDYIGSFKIHYLDTIDGIELSLEPNKLEKEYIAKYINKIDFKLTEEIIKRLF